MPLVEGAATAVLPAEPHRSSSFHQACKRQRFRHSVIHRAFTRAHLRALLKQLLHFRMDVEALRRRCQPVCELAEFFGGNSGFNFILRLIALAFEFVPIIRQLTQTWLFANAACSLLGCFEFRLDGVRPRLCALNSGVLCIKLPKRRMIFDGLVNQRLRNRWIIHFAVPVAAVTDQVDDDVAVEFVAIVKR